MLNFKLNKSSLIFFQKKQSSFLSIDKKSNITKNTFLQTYFSQKPVMITHGLSWPAFQKWQSNHFLDKYSKEVTEHLFEFDIQQGYHRNKVNDVDLSTAIKKMKSNTDNNRKYYIIRQSIANTLPDLLQDISFPKWHPHPALDKYDVNLWMGEAGNKTPIHYDAIQNFLVQVVGEKEIFLFRPNNNFIPKMTPFSSGSGRFNFSTVPHIDGEKNEVFLKMIAHPNYQAYRLILTPGMVLYIPPGWWHQVNTCSFSISVNYFWMEALQKYNSCRSAILDFQATSLYRKVSPEVSKLVNNCTYNNCFTVIEKLIELNENLLATRLCGVFIEGIFEEIKNIFCEDNSKNSDSTSQQDIIAYLKPLNDVFNLSQNEIRLWEIACASYKNNEIFLEANNLIILQGSIKRCFNAISAILKEKEKYHFSQIRGQMLN